MPDIATINEKLDDYAEQLAMLSDIIKGRNYMLDSAGQKELCQFIIEDVHNIIMASLLVYIDLKEVVEEGADERSVSNR